MNKKGFTIAELLVTLSLIAILAVIVAPAVSNLVPDKNKAKVIKYHSLISEAIESILNDEDLYKPYVKYDVNDTESEEPIITYNDLSIVKGGFINVLKAKLDLDNSTGDLKLPDDSTWKITENSDGTSSIEIELDRNASGTIYNNANVNLKKVDTFVFKIDKYGTLSAGDALTDAYLKNPLKMNTRKEDFESAKKFLQSGKTY